jgi:hypothetical protein
MPTLDWAVLCDHALIDAGGKLTLIGLFESITTSVLPGLHPVMGVVSRWRTNPGEIFVLQTKLISPSDVEMASIESRCQSGPNNRHNVVNNMLMTRLPMAGRYRMQFVVNNQVLGELPLEVILARPQ